MRKLLKRSRPRRNLSGVPVEETNLTAKERALLPDPGAVTEDDADAITAYRRRNEPTIPLNKLLKRYGYVRRGKKLAS